MNIVKAEIKALSKTINFPEEKIKVKAANRGRLFTCGKKIFKVLTGHQMHQELKEHFMYDWCAESAEALCEACKIDLSDSAMTQFKKLFEDDSLTHEIQLAIINATIGIDKFTEIMFETNGFENYLAAELTSYDLWLPGGVFRYAYVYDYEQDDCEEDEE